MAEKEVAFRVRRFRGRLSKLVLDEVIQVESHRVVVRAGAKSEDVPHKFGVRSRKIADMPRAAVASTNSRRNRVQHSRGGVFHGDDRGKTLLDVAARGDYLGFKCRHDKGVQPCNAKVPKTLLDFLQKNVEREGGFPDRL